MRDRVSTPARPNLHLVGPGTHTGNQVSNSATTVNSGEHADQHNTAISYNTAAAPISVLASTEYTATVNHTA